jgi:hypothetical protein
MAAEASTRASSSMASTARKMLPPAPPNFSGISTPMRPSSKNFGMMSRLNCAAASMS